MQDFHTQEPPFLIHKVNQAGLWMMPAPVFDKDMATTLKRCRSLRLLHLASLLEEHEVSTFGLCNLAIKSLDNGIKLYQLSLIDRQAPALLSPLYALATLLTQKLHAGESVGVHCKSGIGRSGMLTVIILAQLGFDLSSALNLIEERRGLKAPNTETQLIWLEQNWGTFSKTRIP